MIFSKIKKTIIFFGIVLILLVPGGSLLTQTHGQVMMEITKLPCDDSYLDAKYESWMGNETKRGVGKDGGKYRHYDSGATIYCHSDTGPHETHGEIRKKWKALNYENGYLGYPISDELRNSDGKYRWSNFQGGVICWTSSSGAWDVKNSQGPTSCIPLVVQAVALPQIFVDKDLYQWGEVAEITVNYVHQNKDKNQIDSIEVYVANQKESRPCDPNPFAPISKYICAKTVNLLETDKNSGIFKGSYVITLGFGGDWWISYDHDSNPDTAPFQKSSKFIGKCGQTEFTLDKIAWHGSQVSLDTKVCNLTTVIQKQAYAEKKLIPFDEGNTRLVVNFSDKKILDVVEQFGGKVETTSKNQAQITIPIENIKEISSLATKIQAPILMDTHRSESSEGLSKINADKAHLHGLTGDGIKVAVIDLAFDISNPEIKDNIIISKSFRHSFGEDKFVGIEGFGDEAAHGTAVAEIIVDVAPNVDLYLYTVGTGPEFQNAIDCIIDSRHECHDTGYSDIDIIAMSAGWPNYLTNNQSPITQKLDEATSSGITTVISAGNYGLKHWEGPFSDTNSNQKHNFEIDKDYMPIQVNNQRISDRHPILVYLLWESSSDDFSLFLRDSNGNMVDDSKNNQNEGFSQNMEYISVIPERAETHYLEIVYSGSSPPNSKIELFSPTEQSFEFYTKEGSAAVPTDARNVIKVGAINYNDLILEDFSSQGPTNLGSLVPNVVAPDGVTTDAKPQFFGTSAAAPHVAGIAALLLEQQPNLDPIQVKKEIEKYADKNSVGLDSNFDNRYGYGKADANFLVEIQDSSSESTTPTPTTPTQPNPQEPPPIEEIKNIEIPEWIKDQLKWWLNGAIPDNEVTQAIEYMMEKEIIVISNLPESEPGTGKGIPPWIKTNAKWWIDGKITNADFAKALEFLVKKGIIRVSPN